METTTPVNYTKLIDQDNVIWLSLQEAADRICVSRQTIANWCEAGYLTYRRDHKHRYQSVSQTSLLSFYDNHFEVVLSDEKQIEALKLATHLKKVELEKAYKEICKSYITVLTTKHINKPRQLFEHVYNFYIMHFGHELSLFTQDVLRMVLIEGRSSKEIAKAFYTTENKILRTLNHGLRKISQCVSNSINSYPENIRHYAERCNLQRNHITYLERENKTLRQALRISEKEEIDTLRLSCFKMQIRRQDFSIRTINCLRAADIETLEDLLQYEPKDLLNFRNFGRKSLNEIISFVHNLSQQNKYKGIKLGMYKPRQIK